MRFGLVAGSLFLCLLAVPGSHAAGLTTPPKLHQAIAEADYRGVDALLAEGADLEERDAYGRTPLYVAARKGDTDLTRQLLARGADPNAPNLAGLTPLHAAVARGHEVVAELLLANCASVNSRDRFRRNPLHFAASRGYLELTQRLVESNAALEARLSSGLTPFELAISFDQSATREYLRKQLPPLPPAAEEQAALEDGSLSDVAAIANAEDPRLNTPDEAAAPTAASLRRDRPRGAEATLRFVQEKLTELGYDPGPISGSRNARTMDAVRSFQDSIGVVRESERGQITSCLVDRLTAVSIRLALDAAEPPANERSRTNRGGF